MAAFLKLDLRSRAAAFTGLLAVLLLLAALAASWVFVDLARERYAIDLVSNHAQLAREQLRLPMARELALAQKLADSDRTRSFLADDQDPEQRKAFFAEAESFRRLLTGGTLFAASGRSGHYFFNDNKTPYSDRPRATLDRKEPADAWFFATLEQPALHSLNVNSDRSVNVTKVWINVLVQDASGLRLGLVGTGFDLTKFLQRFARREASGLSSMLIAGNGAIQAHPDPAQIEYQLVAGKPPTHTLFGLMSRQVDRDAVASAMSRLQADPGGVESLAVELEGQRQLIALAWLPELDWYAVSAVGLDSADLFSLPWAWAALLLLVSLLLAALALVYFGTHRLVFKPLLALGANVRQMESGRYDVSLELDSQDEIGELAGAFNRMARRVGQHTEELEATVKERTRELSEALTRQQDNIHCARLIQEAMLPRAALADACQGRQLVFWQPRDIVSGDIYLFHRDADGWLVGLVDCAGHGVTGALMTVLAQSAFQSAIDRVGSRDPAALLTLMDEIVRGPFADQLASRQKVATSMEAGLLRFDSARSVLTYAGARISLYCVDADGVVRVHKGGRRALGERRRQPYENRIVAAGQDCYLTTDGLLDQSGGPKGFGLGSNRFEKILTDIATVPWPARHAMLAAALADWQADTPQLDDICVIGLATGPIEENPARAVEDGSALTA